MRRTVHTLVILAAVITAHAQTSNVETVLGWKRTYIIGRPGGTLTDPTGSLADYARQAAANALHTEASNIVAAAGQGLTNALGRLWAVADRTNDFAGRVYIAADMDADPGYENIEAFTVHEETDTNKTVRYYVHYTRELAQPPKTVWAFGVAEGVTYWSPGCVCTNNTTTNVNGFACYEIAVNRPPETGNMLMRTHRYLKFGAPGQGLDIPDAGLRLIDGAETNTPYTGAVVYTNSGVEYTETYLSGFLYTTITNTLGAP